MCFLAAVPTYAVVDKSAKKGSKKDGKVEEQKPQAEPPQYASVDKPKKTKKKKKEEADATYAQVDMSKKSKKVCHWPRVFFYFLYVIADSKHNMVILQKTQCQCIYVDTRKRCHSVCLRGWLPISWLCEQTVFSI